MQRLNRVTRTPGEITFSHNALLDKPELAALAMATVNIWSQIEAQTASLFAYSIGSQQLFALKILHTLESASARNAQIRLAIEERLGKEAINLFARIIKSGAASSVARNHFAHHLWGKCEGVPDALLLLDPRYLTEHMAGVLDDLFRNLDAINDPNIARAPVRNWDWDKIYVYRRGDFERLIAESDCVHKALKEFQRMFPALGGTSFEAVYTSLVDKNLIRPMP